MAKTIYSYEKQRHVSPEEIKKKYNILNMSKLPGEEVPEPPEGASPSRAQWETAISGIDKLNELYHSALEREKLEEQEALQKYPTNQEFTKQWFKDNGNPYKVNVTKQANSEFRRRLPELMNHVFKGKRKVGDMLTEDEQKVLNKAKQIFYSNIYNRLKSEVANAKDEYAMAMGNLEKDRAEWESKQSKQTTADKIAEKQALTRAEAEEKARLRKEGIIPTKITPNELKGEILYRALYDPDFENTARENEKRIAEKMLGNPEDEATKFALSWMAKNQRWNYVKLDDPKEQKILLNQAKLLAGMYKRMKGQKTVGKALTPEIIKQINEIVGDDEEKMKELAWQLGYRVPGYSDEM